MSTFTNTAREVEMPNGDVVVIHNAPTGGENTTSNIKKFKYDDNGHVTESTAADAEDLNLSSYSTPTTGTTAIGASDDVQTAIGKLDHQSHIDQTNILLVQDATKELVDKGAKNIFDITTPDLLRDTVVTPLSNGGATLSCNNAAWTQYGKNIDVEVGKKYKVIVYIDSITGSVGTDFNVNLSQGSTFLPITPTNTGEYSVEVESTATTLGVAIFINNSGTPKSLSINMRMMICTLDEWKVSQNFAPYALPNYDLTRLEAEDRAGLIEVVDFGAKNKLKLDKDAIKSLNSGGTWSGYVYTPVIAPNLTVTINDDGTVTLNGSTSSSLVTVALERKASSGFQGYVLSGSKANTKLVYQLAVSPYTVYATADGVGSAVIANYTDGSTIQLSLQIVENSTFSNTVITPMICTKADWDVSHKFKPYSFDAINSKNYSATTTDGTFAQLIKNATKANGVTGVITYMASIYSDTSNEYLLLFGQYNDETFHNCVKLVNNTIDLTVVNMGGTIACSGGTGTLYAKVKLLI